MVGWFFPSNIPLIFYHQKVGDDIMPLISPLWANQWVRCWKYNRIKYHVVGLFFFISGIMTGVKFWLKNEARWIYKDQVAKKVENGVISSGEAVNELMEVAAKVLLQSCRLLRLPPNVSHEGTGPIFWKGEISYGSATVTCWRKDSINLYLGSRKI